MAIDYTELQNRYGSGGRRGGGVRTNAAEVFAKLDKLAETIKTNTVFVGSQAAAEVFYREAKLRAPVSDGGHWFYGTQYKVNGVKYWFEAGTLRDSIYQAQSKDNSGNGKATYHVAWNHRKCPYGFMVEYGTANAPAHPFLRPAYDAGKPDALIAAKAAMADHMKAAK